MNGEKKFLMPRKSCFSSKGYEETLISDIMDMADGAKGMFYQFFQSKEDTIHALGNKMFFENNLFDAIKEQNDLNGLQKIKTLLLFVEVLL